MPHSSGKLIIAVDGYSSCGKSTLAKDIAKELGYVYIDSGAMYRAVTLNAIRSKVIIKGEIDLKRLDSLLEKTEITFEFNPLTSKSDTILNGENIEEEIRKPEVAQNVSNISKIETVRKKLTVIQREFGKNRGIVMDGRDIGTVVFPDADIKIFMTASPEIRAQRRFAELKEKNIDESYENVLLNLNERDFIDSNRAASPLKKACDAHEIDNSWLTRVEQLELAMKIIKGVAG